MTEDTALVLEAIWTVFAFDYLNTFRLHAITRADRNDGFNGTESIQYDIPPSTDRRRTRKSLLTLTLKC